MNTWVRREKNGRELKAVETIAYNYPSIFQIIQCPEIYEETVTETQQFMEHNPGLREKSGMKATSASPEHLINAVFFNVNSQERKRERWKQKELTRNRNHSRVAGPQLKAFGDLQAETNTGRNPESQI